MSYGKQTKHPLLNTGISPEGKQAKEALRIKPASEVSTAVAHQSAETWY